MARTLVKPTIKSLAAKLINISEHFADCPFFSRIPACGLLLNPFKLGETLVFFVIANIAAAFSTIAKLARIGLTYLNNIADSSILNFSIY